MIFISGDALTEYEAKLLSLADEHSLLKEVEVATTARLKEIRDEIITTATVLGGSKERVVFPLQEAERAWDRRVVRKGGGVNLDLLEERLGVEVFHKVACDRTVRYEFSPTKFDNARRRGKITEEDLVAVTQEPSISYAVALTKGIPKDDE